MNLEVWALTVAVTELSGGNESMVGYGYVVDEGQKVGSDELEVAVGGVVKMVKM